ncbi:MAG: HD-GYP domain-containing protein [Spirochaetes bacterium]|nr:HD-GYP domain-containing protein [Spirochaetota bacterium]
MGNIDFHSFVNSLSRVIEYKDLYTHGHSDRVADLSALIALEMGLSEDLVDEIHIAAHLHDIGKTGIPDGILMKSGKLNHKEYSIMQDHSLIGYDILKEVKGLKAISLMVKYHHEKFDGTGYPDRLKKDEIPLGARIITLADSFDAMTTPRPYQKARSIEEAVIEISKSKKKHFDPDITDYFLKVIEAQKDYILSIIVKTEGEKSWIP